MVGVDLGSGVFVGNGTAPGIAVGAAGGSDSTATDGAGAARDGDAGEVDAAGASRPHPESTQSRQNSNTILSARIPLLCHMGRQAVIQAAHS